jgi:hypothetical protein
VMGMFGIIIMVIENELSSAGVYTKVLPQRWHQALYLPQFGQVSFQLNVVLKKGLFCQRFLYTIDMKWDKSCFYHNLGQVSFQPISSFEKGLFCQRFLYTIDMKWGLGY